MIPLAGGPSAILFFQATLTHISLINSTDSLAGTAHSLGQLEQTRTKKGVRMGEGKAFCKTDRDMNPSASTKHKSSLTLIHTQLYHHDRHLHHQHCSSQPSRQPQRASPSGLHGHMWSPPHVVTVLVSWPTIYGKRAGVSRLRLGCRRHCSFCLDPFLGSLTLGKASCHVMSIPMQRPTWQGTATQVSLKADPPASDKPWDHWPTINL